MLRREETATTRNNSFGILCAAYACSGYILSYAFLLISKFNLAIGYFVVVCHHKLSYFLFKESLQNMRLNRTYIVPRHVAPLFFCAPATTNNVVECELCTSFSAYCSLVHMRNIYNIYDVCALLCPRSIRALPNSARLLFALPPESRYRWILKR